MNPFGILACGVGRHDGTGTMLMRGRKQTETEMAISEAGWELRSSNSESKEAYMPDPGSW